MRSTTENDYRIGIAMQSGRLVLHVEGPDGPTRRKHVREVRAAAARCGFAVVECENEMAMR